MIGLMPSLGRFAIPSFLAVLMMSACTPEPGGNPTSSAREQDDPLLWLEETRGDRVMDWVKKQNAVTTAEYASTPSFDSLRSALLEVLDSDDRIPYVNRMGDHLYNFWQDKAHPRGLWRRTVLTEYRKADPEWEVLLDIDALNKAENASWVYKDVQCLKPDYERCLVSLSPDGGDAVSIREFNITSRSFVTDGFFVPAAKTWISWIDDDHIYVATDFGKGTMTTSSYPRIVKEWTRGTQLSSASVVLEVKPEYMTVAASHDRTPGFGRSLVYAQRDFYNGETYLRGSNGLVRIEVPDDAVIDVHREWLLVKIKTPWKIGDTTWPAGALLATNFDAFMTGKRELVAIFTPDERSALDGYSWTRNHLLLNTIEDVKSRLEVLTPGVDEWKRSALPGAPTFSTVKVVNADPDNSDEYWLNVTGFLEPASLQRGVLGDMQPQLIKRSPAFFDASGLVVSQHFVTSKDGTRVPYFQVAPKGMRLDGSNRVLESGYGGFEVSLMPAYSGVIGRAWLARGGVFVVANIRGGGEYGPAWHQAALKANRPRAYEDFAAVAEDLIKRGVTTAAHLGAEGGSNGGLLMGNMLTQYPELFGAIACGVPLLDMKRYVHLNAGASWMAEYGDPDTDDWSFIRTFSPYHNVKADGRYPPVLFYTATSDDRVGPAQARKMTARMEDMGLTHVWFYENTEGGHGASADNRQAAYMRALVYQFLWKELDKIE